MSLVKGQRAIDRPPEVQSETANGAPASDSRYAGIQNRRDICANDTSACQKVTVIDVGYSRCH
jgi:hypothetical protein